jgi:hypothetical protein
VDGQEEAVGRANNFISEKIKVNDLRGNPIEIAAQIVWRVVDTAQALFDVDDYKQFVRVQVEAAIRTIGSRYPYDDFEHQEVTLRGNHDQVGAELRTELQRGWRRRDHDRRMRLHHLAYATEIAGAMLRRQQARRRRGAPDPGRRRGRHGRNGACIAVRKEGRRARRRAPRGDGSNLMVVLCGERDTQPVVNTGTLYIGRSDARRAQGLSASRRPALWAAVERCAAADLRSVNAQVECLLREALAGRGVKLKAPEPRKRGRPPGSHK